MGWIDIDVDTSVSVHHSEIIGDFDTDDLEEELKKRSMKHKVGDDNVLTDIIGDFDTEDLEKELKKRSMKHKVGDDNVLRTIQMIDVEMRTEQVKEVYEHIVGSYHYDVFKKEYEDEKDDQ